LGPQQEVVVARIDPKGPLGEAGFEVDDIVLEVNGHPAPQWLTMDAAVKHCTEGIGIWPWASNG
jgi:S1-C subfamily serine protease